MPDRKITFLTFILKLSKKYPLIQAKVVNKVALVHGNNQKRPLIAYIWRDMALKVEKLLKMSHYRNFGRFFFIISCKCCIKSSCNMAKPFSMNDCCVAGIILGTFSDVRHFALSRLGQKSLKNVLFRGSKFRLQASRNPV